jgi:hypothetical protein
VILFSRSGINHSTCTLENWPNPIVLSTGEKMIAACMLLMKRRCMSIVVSFIEFFHRSKSVIIICTNTCSSWIAAPTRGIVSADDNGILSNL